MLNRTKNFIIDALDLYFGKRVTRAAAALSYYLILSIFPLIICLYTMLGSRYEQAVGALGLIAHFMSEGTAATIEEYLVYVADNNSTAMLIAALFVLVASASGAFRSFQHSVGEMQGQVRFRGVGGFLLSLAFSLVFLVAMYVAIILVVTGSWFIDFLARLLPFAAIGGTWTWFRFVILFAVVFLIIYVIYYVTVPPRARYRVMPGALAATGALVAVSIVFSLIIGVSARYPLVYGSLASIILLMLWLYACSLVILLGEVINIVLRDRKERKKREA